MIIKQQNYKKEILKPFLVEVVIEQEAISIQSNHHGPNIYRDDSTKKIRNFYQNILKFQKTFKNSMASSFPFSLQIIAA